MPFDRRPVPLVAGLALLFASVSGGPIGLASPWTGDGVPLTVTVEGIRPAEGGNLLVALHLTKKSWLSFEGAVATRSVPVTSPTETVVFEGVAPGGPYAVQVVHDRNANGKLDMRWFPFPKPREGAGVSNNKTGMGPPNFDDAAFTVGGTALTLSIQLRY